MSRVPLALYTASKCLAYTVGLTVATMQAQQHVWRKDARRMAEAQRQLAQVVSEPQLKSELNGVDAHLMQQAVFSLQALPVWRASAAHRSVRQGLFGLMALNSAEVVGNVQFIQHENQKRATPPYDALNPVERIMLHQQVLQPAFAACHSERRLSSARHWFSGAARSRFYSLALHTPIALGVFHLNVVRLERAVQAFQDWDHFQKTLQAARACGVDTASTSP